MSASAADAGAVLAALADPTRRRIVMRLAEGAQATATQLARELPVTRQAVARHLATLRRARLVRADRAGRETRYTLQPDALRAAQAWIDEVGERWDTRLDRLAAMAEESEGT